MCAVEPCDQFRNSGLARAVEFVEQRGEGVAVTSRDESSYRGKKAEHSSQAGRLDQVTTSTILSLKVHDR